MPWFSLNGQICNETDARIPVMDHGFLYGDGVFEGLRFYHGKVLEMNSHLDRLKASADALAMKLPVNLSEVSRAITELVDHTKMENGYLRVIVTRGCGPLGINPVQCGKGNLVIIADELSMIDPEIRSGGASLIIASTRRLGGDQLDSRIKSLNYLNQIMARIEANAAGADEAVVLNQAGFVAEGTADNIFIVKDGILITPPVTDGALDGITRGLVLELAKNNGLEVRVCSLTPYDLYTADECFLTGTGAELIPVRQVSSRLLKTCPGEIFHRIEQLFQRRLKEAA